MRNITKSLSLLIILFLTVPSLFTVKQAIAQPTPTPIPPYPPTPSTAPFQPTPTPIPSPNTTPSPTPSIESINKPSIPEFSIKLVNGPYDVPSSYVISPFTGKNVTIPGLHIEKRAILITIKNQPFTSYYDANSGWNISLYYNVRTKLHSAENWTVRGGVEDLPIRTDSEYTILVNENVDSYQIGAQVDFQVEAMEGYIRRVWNPNATNQLEMLPYRFIGQTSGWSNTQTLLIYDPSLSPFISIVSPENTTYTAIWDPVATIPLTYKTDRSLSWIGYSLDGDGNVTAPENGTLLKIPAGSQSLTLYANDTIGNWAVPQTVYYRIAFNLGIVPDQFPIVPVTLSVVIIVIITVFLLVHFRKHKTHNLKNPPSEAFKIFTLYGGRGVAQEQAVPKPERNQPNYKYSLYIRGL